ncbi:MAG: aminotransferase class V-fold PLP-dependent enzyme [Candidatus Hodarchaeota archaeon]
MDNSEKESSEAFNKLERTIYMALETYSNVHRGTGHNSMVTTALYEQARKIILEYLQLNKNKYVVFFCSPLRSEIFKTQLSSKHYHILSSQDFGLPLGVKAIAVKKKALRKCSVIYTGGGMIKHVTSNYVVWADLPERFEPGTPNIVNVIAFATALHSIKHPDKIFKSKLANWIKSSSEILYQDKFVGFSGKELLLKLQKSLIGYDIKVPTKEGKKKFINLDNAASTPSFLPIWNTFCQILRQPEERQPEIIEDVRNICAKFLNAPLEKYDVIFTSNTTEAINIVARSLTKSSKKNIKPVIVNTLLEHHSNELPYRYIPGASLTRISVDDEGFIDLKELEGILRDYNQYHKYGIKRIQVIALSGVSNVLGTYNDLQSISRIVHKYDAKFLVDGAQMVAHHKMDISNTNVDFFAFSGHKSYAPFGCGVLIVKKGVLTFDSDEINKIKNSGEENVIGIGTLGKAILLLERIGIDVIEDYERELTRITLNGLNKIKDLEIFGVKYPSSNKFNNRGSIISFNLKKVPHNIAAKELAEYGGIGIRNGCFCAHMLIQRILKIQRIRIVGARMTSIIIPKKTEMCLPGTLRVSFGIENDETDVACLLKSIEEISQQPRSIIDRVLAYTNNGTLFIPRTKTEEKIKCYVNSTTKKVYSL